MRNAKLVVGMGVVVGAAWVAAACTSNNNSGPPAGSDGGASSSGGSSSGGSSSGSSSGASSSGGSSSGSSSGASSSGGGTDGGVSVVAQLTLPGVPGSMAYNATTSELWVTSTGTTDAGTATSAITVVDATTFTATATISYTGSGAGFGAIAVAPDLNKAYVGNATSVDGGGFVGEIDEIDGTTHAVKIVTPLEASFQTPNSIAYDPVQHRVYVSTGSAGNGYLDVIDATTDTLVATYPTSVVSGAGLGGYGNVVVDPTGSVLYALAGDINSYPLVATIPVDGGAPFDVLGGQAAGWETSQGPVLVTTDAGASGVAAIGLNDGGAFLQLIDPGTIQLSPGDVVSSISVVTSPGSDRGDIVVGVTDACGHRVARVFDPQTGVQLGGALLTDLFNGNEVLLALTFIDPPTAPGAALHAAVNIQPQGSGNGAPIHAITEITFNSAVVAGPPCP